MSNKDNSTRLINLVLNNKVLQWGDIVLKSGRKSPYFLNLGKLTSGSTANELAELYAKTTLSLIEEIVAPFSGFWTLLGPAYKGIPIAVLTASVLARKKHPKLKEVRYAFTRKENKDHGEKGKVVGDLFGDVIVIDDVMTAGTATTQALQLVRDARLSGSNCRESALIVAFDRMETPSSGGDLTAMETIELEWKIRTRSIANVNDLCIMLKNMRMHDQERILHKHLTIHGCPN